MATDAGAQATEADLLDAPRDGRKYELVDGQIRVSPAGGRHGLVIVALTVRLVAFVKQAGLGYVFESSTGFRLPKGNVRSPDLSFVACGRFENDVVPEGFIPFPPDLAVEVLSPEDRSRTLLEKVGEYLDAGVRIVWVIDPRARKASIPDHSRPSMSFRRTIRWTERTWCPAFSASSARSCRRACLRAWFRTFIGQIASRRVDDRAAAGS